MEKFALLNLLKALETLSPADKKPKNDEPAQAPAETKDEKPAQTEKPQTVYPENNVMASVISRHEQISNRLKNKK